MAVFCYRLFHLMLLLTILIYCKLFHLKLFLFIVDYFTLIIFGNYKQFQYMVIGGYFTCGYWLLFYWGYWWLLIVILFIVIVVVYW